MSVMLQLVMSKICSVRFTNFYVTQMFSVIKNQSKSFYVSNSIQMDGEPETKLWCASRSAAPSRGRIGALRGVSIDLLYRRHGASERTGERNWPDERYIHIARALRGPRDDSHGRHFSFHRVRGLS